MLHREKNLCKLDRCGFLGTFADFNNLLILSLNLWIPRRFPTNMLQHLERFFMPSHRSEESWRVGKESDKDGEDDGGDALESEEESPSEGGPAFEIVGAAFHECETKGDPVGDRDAEVVGLQAWEEIV